MAKRRKYTGSAAIRAYKSVYGAKPGLKVRASGTRKVAVSVGRMIRQERLSRGVDPNTGKKTSNPRFKKQRSLPVSGRPVAGDGPSRRRTTGTKAGGFETTKGVAGDGPSRRRTTGTKAGGFETTKAARGGSRGSSASTSTGTSGRARPAASTGRGRLPDKIMSGIPAHRSVADIASRMPEPVRNALKRGAHESALKPGRSDVVAPGRSTQPPTSGRGSSGFYDSNKKPSVSRGSQPRLTAPSKPSTYKPPTPSTSVGRFSGVAYNPAVAYAAATRKVPKKTFSSAVSNRLGRR